MNLVPSPASLVLAQGDVDRFADQAGSFFASEPLWLWICLAASACLVLTGLLTIPFAFRFPRLGKDNPLELTRSRKRLKAVTGIAVDPSTRTTTSTSVHVQHDPNHGSSTTVTETSTLHREFFLRTDDGNETPILLVNFDVPVRSGHRLSCVWAQDRHLRTNSRDIGPIVVVNHSTQQHYVNNQTLRLAFACGKGPLRCFWAAIAMVALIGVARNRFSMNVDTQNTLIAYGVLAVLVLIPFAVASTIRNSMFTRRFRGSLAPAIHRYLDRQAASS